MVVNSLEFCGTLGTQILNKSKINTDNSNIMPRKYDIYSILKTFKFEVQARLVGR